MLLGDPNLFGDRLVVGWESGPVSVREIPKAQADKIIRAGHYSGTAVWSSSVHLGVFLDGDLIGAMQMGPAMNPRSGGRIVDGAEMGTWLELNRLWLVDDKPPNTTSRAISCALRWLRHTRPEVQWIQSFADERCGKLGAVYQACSFLYVGSHASKFYEIDGQWFHKSMFERKGIDKRGWRQGQRLVFAQANQHRATEHVFNQYRYLHFLDRRARRRLLLDPLPYPKPDQ